MPLLETIGSGAARGLGLFGKTGPNGLTSAAAAESAVQLKLDFPGYASGTYWIKINGTPRQIYCDMTTNGGGWMLIYELTNPIRSTPGDIFSFAVDNSSYFGSSYSFTRVAHRLQNNMGNGGTSFYSFAAMDKISTQNPLTVRPPDANNAYFFNENVTNLFVDSNYNQSWVTNRNAGDSGRVNIWPSNYGTSSTFGDGDGATYDHDDSGAVLTMGYGSFQIFNMNAGLTNSRQVVLAWNSHASALENQCVGFGRNVSGNPYATATPEPDWTFANNGFYNFKLQGFIK